MDVNGKMQENVEKLWVLMEKLGEMRKTQFRKPKTRCLLYTNSRFKRDVISLHP